MYKIRQIREQLGLSKYEVCKRTGLTFHTILKIEAGADTRVSTLSKIAKALNVEVKELFK